MEHSGLQDLHARFIDIPTTRPELLTWLSELRALLNPIQP